MPFFNYKAKQGPTKVIDGQIEASNVDHALLKISQLGLTPLDVQQTGEQKWQAPNPAKISFSFQFTPSKISRRDLVEFTRQLSDLLDAAVPILRSLQIIAKQTTNPKLKEVVNQLSAHTQEGGSLSEGMRKYPDLFSNLYRNMIRTGELSGQLDQVLQRLAEFMEKDLEVRSKVVSSLAYPSFILAIGFLSIFVLMSFIVPQLSQMFEDLDQTLPMVTVVLINISGFFASFWWLILIALAGLGILLVRVVKTPAGKKQLDMFLNKLPVIGNFLLLTEMARMSRTLGTLLENGVPMTTALQAITAIIQNSLFKEELKAVALEVSNGKSLRATLRKSEFVPEYALNMISVGEETGGLEKSLFKVANIYDKKSEEMMKVIISLLGPIVLVLVILIVLVVVIAMMLPILQMDLII